MKIIALPFLLSVACLVLQGCAGMEPALSQTEARSETSGTGIQMIVQAYRLEDRMEPAKKMAEANKIELIKITAFELALQHSQQLSPTTEEFNTILQDLNTIAEREKIREWTVPAKRFFHFSKLVLTFKPEHYNQVSFWKNQIEIPEIDDLCRKLRLRGIRSPAPSSQFYSSTAVELLFENPLNMALAVQEFARYDAVLEKTETIFQPTYEIGDGDWIDMAGYALYRRYVYAVGWGDCSSGCISRKYVYYAPDSSGNLSKAGEYIYDYPAQSGTPLWGILR